MYDRIRDAGGRLLWATGLTAAARRTIARKGRFALLLHGVSSRRLPGVDTQAQPHFTMNELSFLLAWLRDRFTLLTPEQYFRADTPGVLLTFDDGFANNFHNALPVLRSYECPAVFFVSTQHVADPRNWLAFVRRRAEQTWGSVEDVTEAVARDWYDGLTAEELRRCAADPLITIGAHGVTHRVLTECTDAELSRELAESRSFLQDVTGHEIDYFAYPRGKYDARVAARTKAAGYTAAFTIDPLSLGLCRFELPRVGIYRADPGYLGLKLSGLHRRPLPLENRRSPEQH